MNAFDFCDREWVLEGQLGRLVAGAAEAVALSAGHGDL